ncbi:MAG: rod shape-determining protein MreD [Spirochaetales bacterium]|nr:rod shape-determining protein MreD [Spirochaetales bacterium]
MIRRVLISALIMAGIVVLKSTLLADFTLFQVQPDFVLIVLIVVSLRKGAFVGETSGFLVGLVEDMMSISPPGFYASIRLITGFLYGLIRNNIFIDPVLMPMLIVIAGTILKGLLAGIIGSIFAIESINVDLLGSQFWIEAGLNAVLAPFLFAVLKMIPFFEQDKDVV